MPFLAIALVIQIVIGGILLQTSENSSSAKVIRHALKQVLGASLIAQNDTNAISDQPTDAPTQPTDAPIQPTDAPIPQQSHQQSETPMPTYSLETTSVLISDTPIPSSTDLSPNPAQTSENQQGNPSPTETSTSSWDNSSSSSNTDSALLPTSPLNSSPQAITALLNPSNTLIKTDDIGETAITTSQKQDNALASAETPQDKTNILISSAQDNIREIASNLQSTDFTTTTFLTARLSDHLTQTQEIAKNAQPLLQIQLKKQAKAFCQLADLSLQTQQLQVPERLEQDIEIARGTCLSIQQ